MKKKVNSPYSDEKLITEHTHTWIINWTKGINSISGGPRKMTTKIKKAKFFVCFFD